jgi:hypothetical protein
MGQILKNCDISLDLAVSWLDAGSRELNAASEWDIYWVAMSRRKIRELYS